ncbi:hypothetical protein DL769_009257 [Monosporascus sp. CRB-8-3]|nr:hypothetical protein DL769_009257 [Monosporascus sp. CRB-8-3]
MRLALYKAVLRTGPISILVFFSTLGMTVFETARVPVLEDAICRALASDDCRQDHLAQARLATINSWIEIVTSVQAHAAAESTVRLELVLLFRVIESVGGGFPVAQVLLNSLLARQTIPETRASVFYLVSTLLVLGRAGGTALCGVVLDSNAGVVIPAAIIIYALNLPVIALFGRDVDRTKVIEAYRESGTGSDHHLLPFDDDAREQEARDSDLGGGDNDIATEIADTTGSVATTIASTLAQWLVHRFAWTFSAVAYVNAYIAVLCLITLASLPILTAHLISRYNGHTQKMEVTILRMSVAAFTLSSLGIGLSPNRGVYILAVSFAALSVGSFDTFKSLLSGFCATDLLSELYATISLVETAVHIVASRMWTLILIKSFDLKGVLKGLPYLVSSGLGLVAFSLIWYMAGCVNAYQPVYTTEDERENDDDPAL